MTDLIIHRRWELIQQFDNRGLQERVINLIGKWWLSCRTDTGSEGSDPRAVFSSIWPLNPLGLLSLVPWNTALSTNSRNFGQIHKKLNHENAIVGIYKKVELLWGQITCLLDFLSRSSKWSSLIGSKTDLKWGFQSLRFSYGHYTKCRRRINSRYCEQKSQHNVIDAKRTRKQMEENKKKGWMLSEGFEPSTVGLKAQSATVTLG